MAKTLYAPLNGVSDEVKKILVSTGGLSDYVVKGYCSVGGLSKLFFGVEPTPPSPVTYAIFENGDFTNITSPSCRTKSIVHGGDIGTASASSNGVIINKNLGWFYEYSRTASYPWTFSNNQLVSGNIKNITGIQDYSENTLTIPVLGSIINIGSVGTDMGGKIVLTMKGTDKVGPFVLGHATATLYNGLYYFSTVTSTRVFFNPQAQSGYPLDTVVTIEHDMTNNQLSDIQSHLHDGYWFLSICAPPNNGYTPKVYIDKIEYVDLNS